MPLKVSRVRLARRYLALTSVSGKDERQASSPSFFNIQEASAVRDYVKELKMGLGLSECSQFRYYVETPPDVWYSR